MKGLAVVIPYKGGSHKARLAHLLGAADRGRLSLLMLQDVFDVLEEAGLAHACVLVSSDPDALRAAKTRGAIPLRESTNRGVNAAVRAGIRGSDASHFLVLPADLPVLRRSDIDRIIGLKQAGADVVISPSSAFDGTNVLLASKGRMPKLSYDRDSFWNHLDNAAKKSLTLAVYTSTGVMFDIDTEEDLRRLARLRINRRSVVFARARLGLWQS